MTNYYRGSIVRNNTEYEVTAKLYDHGKVEGGLSSFGDDWQQVIVEDPLFTDFVCFDEYGVEMTLTPREILQSEKQMIDTYWEEYTSD